MSTNTLLTLLLTVSLVQACGQDGDDKKKTESNGDAGNLATDGELVEDSELAGQTVSAQIDDAVAGVAEEQEGTGGLTLADGGVAGEAKWYRSCDDSGTSAVVDIKRNATRTITWDNDLRSGQTAFAAYYEKQRTWSKEGGEVDCAEGKKFAAVPLADMEAVSLDVTFKHQRSRTTTIESKKTEKTYSRSFRHEAEGERHVTWTSVATEGGVVTINKELSSSSTRKLEITNKNGDVKTIEGSIATAEGAPLQVELKRDAATLELQSRLIKSGTLVAVNKNGGRVETSFADVLYERGQGCVASSGQITGKIYEKDGTEPKLTFTIDLSGDTKSISFSNGEEYEYSPEGCDLDEPDAPTEAAAATDVENPVE